MFTRVAFIAKGTAVCLRQWCDSRLRCTSERRKPPDAVARGVAPSFLQPCACLAGRDSTAEDHESTMISRRLKDFLNDMDVVH